MDETISTPELLTKANRDYIARKGFDSTLTRNGTLTVSGKRFSIAIRFDLSPEGKWIGCLSVMTYVEKDSLASVLDEANAVGKALLAGTGKAVGA